MRMPDVVFYWSGEEFQLCTGPECHKSVTDVFLYTGKAYKLTIVTHHHLDIHLNVRHSDESRVMSQVIISRKSDDE